MDCHQEDRYRQTLTPRGHVEHLEFQLSQCEMLLKQYLGPDFKLERLDSELLHRGMILGDPQTLSPYTSMSMLADADLSHPGGDPNRGIHPYPTPAMAGVPFLYPGGPPFGHGPMAQPLNHFTPGGHPFPTSVYGYPPPATELKGVDPKKNDVSTEHVSCTFDLPERR